jgi:predicted membrane protein
MFLYYTVKALAVVLIIAAVSYWGIYAMIAITVLTAAYLIGFRIINGYWEEHPLEKQRKRHR